MASHVTENPVPRMPMKDNLGEEKSPIREFDDRITELIDGAGDELTLAEVVGTLELQLHILKNRMTGYKQTP